MMYLERLGTIIKYMCEETTKPDEVQENKKKYSLPVLKKRSSPSPF